MSDSGDLQDRMLACLEKVIDPELRCDIVNLGLVYGLNFENGIVTVTMTLTTMGCPIMEVLEQMVQKSLRELPEVKDVKVELVWEPAWTIDRMSRYAKMALGIH
ncbi:metal-sulfur cluster assembly factor [Convivina intestini]|uniref:Metal-sulfur cluster biosynthetic enzyme n=1 Tax=Convivina intestini TaxID=1505726 RepID=A0A2U1DCD3_9LACO|nr:metal-sulfur cluster assembly factor [Convivina intestini]PVY85222.1 metal-sulfur cluster biosynthetic enzyme [Convivina intestini]CAH1852486.1 Fe-S protein maturation auxiliary factor SufT [Convivina intestini]CAH1854605.1 Fe-S protein maturation auxiliary factor SufT [Convivina intestini]SDC01236.1 Metal-sulfur cluster biosynthetic enzyme [Leuconostocaceae bacterium R-53105]